MDSFVSLIKSLIPIVEPLGESGINALFADVIDPYIATMPDSNDLKTLLVCLSPALKQFMILELQKLK